MTIPRTQLSEVMNINDPLYGDNFELYFPQLPAALNTQGYKDGLRIQCKTATIPGLQNEAQDITIHGFKVSTAGRTVFSNTLSVGYIESRDLLVQRALKNWVNSVRDFRTQKSVGKQKYAVGGQLLIYDETGTVSTVMYLHNCFCAEVQDVSLDGSSANIVDVSATFRYDFADESDSSTLTNSFH